MITRTPVRFAALRFTLCATISHAFALSRYDPITMGWTYNEHIPVTLTYN